MNLEGRWEEYRRVIRAILRCEHVPPNDLDDLEATCWQKVADRILSGEITNDNIFQFIPVIARRQVLDFHKKRDRLKRVGGHVFASEESLRTVPDPTPDVSAQFERTELRSELADAIARLPGEQRVVLQWFYLEGMPLKEVAQRLDIPRQAVAARLRRGKNALRNLMLGQTATTDATGKRVDDGGIRQAAAEALRSIGPAAEEPLLEALKDDSVASWETVAGEDVLNAIDERRNPLFLPVYGSPHAGKTFVQQSCDPLAHTGTHALGSNPTSEVGGEGERAVETLGAIVGAMAEKPVSTLMETLRIDDAEVGQAAAEALGLIGSSHQLLGKAIVSDLTSDPGVSVYAGNAASHLTRSEDTGTAAAPVDAVVLRFFMSALDSIQSPSVHRDMGTTNVHFSYFSEVKPAQPVVIDFGLAKLPPETKDAPGSLIVDTLFGTVAVASQAGILSSSSQAVSPSPTDLGSSVTTTEADSLNSLHTLSSLFCSDDLAMQYFAPFNLEGSKNPAGDSTHPVFDVLPQPTTDILSNILNNISGALGCLLPSPAQAILLDSVVTTSDVLGGEAQATEPAIPRFSFIGHTKSWSEIGVDRDNECDYGELSVDEQIPLTDRAPTPPKDPAATKAESGTADHVRAEHLDALLATVPQEDGVERLEVLQSLIDAFRARITTPLQDAINSYLGEIARSQTVIGGHGRQKSEDSLTFDQKQKIARFINDNLEGLGLAIAHKGHPCNFACTTGATQGRFLLVPKGSKTALLTRMRLSDFLPMTLVDAQTRHDLPKGWRESEEHRQRGTEGPSRT